MGCLASQPSLPIRAEVDVKLGGTQCNIILSRLKPWLRLHFSKKKKMVLREESSPVEKPPSNDTKPIMWTCTVSAPEMTIVLYGVSGSSLYHVSNMVFNHLYYNALLLELIIRFIIEVGL